MGCIEKEVDQDQCLHIHISEALKDLIISYMLLIYITVVFLIQVFSYQNRENIENSFSSLDKVVVEEC
jgi:hypothetical protein